MNRKIALTMLILCIVYIVGFYILKFAFPNELLLLITDPNIVKFGNFLESNKFCYILCQSLSTLITFYLFVSASKGSFKVKWIEALYLAVATLICQLVNIYAVEIYVHTSICCMFVLALLCKGKFFYSVIAFTIHGFLSQFLFSIRGFETIILSINTASGIVLTIECWVWLILIGLIFYLKEKENGRLVSTIFKQNGRKTPKRTGQSPDKNSESKKEI